jgi:hypothetical protein
MTRKNIQQEAGCAEPQPLPEHWRPACRLAKLPVQMRHWWTEKRRNTNMSAHTQKNTNSVRAMKTRDLNNQCLHGVDDVEMQIRDRLAADVFGETSAVQQLHLLEQR